MNTSQRSENIDDSVRTLSVLDEPPAEQVMFNLPHRSSNANSVWGDIHRNYALNSVRNPPEELTPDG